MALLLTHHMAAGAWPSDLLLVPIYLCFRRHIQRQLAACSQDIRPDGLDGPQLRDSLFSGFVRGCNKYMGAHNT